MNANHVRILRYVADSGTTSCIEIMEALQLRRNVVYPFLYKARCYGTGKKWIDNKKELPKDPFDPDYARVGCAPGQYEITQAGLDELARIAD